MLVKCAARRRAAQAAPRARRPVLGHVLGGIEPGRLRGTPTPKPTTKTIVYNIYVKLPAPTPRHRLMLML